MAKAGITVKSGKKRGSTITRAEALRAVAYVNQTFKDGASSNSTTVKPYAVTIRPTRLTGSKAKK